MKFERSNTYNWENAMHGLRHPMESYAKGDTMWYEDTTENELKCGNEALAVDSANCMFLGIGPNDMDLAQRMIKAGSPNDKFLRQIFVSVDITAPLYWWKEMDTYKVGTVANSTSTMHKLANILSAIEESKQTTLDKVIAGIGIPLIGTKAGKDLSKKFETYENFRKAESFLDIDAIGRNSLGVIGIKLKEGDEVLDALPVHKETDYLAVVCTNGVGKKLELSEIPVQGRASVGVSLAKNPVAGIAMVDDNNSLVICSAVTSICISAKEIPLFKKAAEGNILTKTTPVKSIGKI